MGCDNCRRLGIPTLFASAGGWGPAARYRRYTAFGGVAGFVQSADAKVSTAVNDAKNDLPSGAQPRLPAKREPPRLTLG